MNSDNKETIRQIVGMSNSKDFGAIADVFAADCTMRTPDGDMHGVDGARQLMAAYATAFPDSEMTIERLVADGDDVVLHYTFSGTNTGMLGPVPATGKRLPAAHGATVFQCSGGKVKDARWVWDRLHLRQHLGLLPAD